jgi:hypothetical protein
MARFNYLERVRVLSQNLDNANFLFSSVFPAIRRVEFNCDGITDLSRMFQYSQATQPLTVELTNTSSATDFNRMFDDCPPLQSVLVDTSNGTDFEYMFYNCRSLKSITLDCSSGTNFGHMFLDCRALESVTLDTSSGIEFGNMFRDCRSLKSVTLDTSNGTDFGGMFDGCQALQSVTLDTSSGTNFTYMFYNCRALQFAPNINFSSITSAFQMFRGSISLAAVDLDWVLVIGVNDTFTYEGALNDCYLSASALNKVYTDLPDVTGEEVASPEFGVSGNYGVDDEGHDPTIATAKGWTITF